MIVKPTWKSDIRQEFKVARVLDSQLRQISNKFLDFHSSNKRNHLNLLNAAQPRPGNLLGSVLEPSGWIPAPDELFPGSRSHRMNRSHRSAAARGKERLTIGATRRIETRERRGEIEIGRWRREIWLLRRMFRGGLFQKEEEEKRELSSSAPACAPQTDFPHRNLTGDDVG